MNQFAHPAAFEAVSPVVNSAIFAEFGVEPLQLRGFAARFKMHHAIIHRLGPATMRMADATYGSTVRDFAASHWMLGDLLSAPSLEKLHIGGSAVSWHCDTSRNIPRKDPFGRLDIRFGISVPFHNAHGNHVALTLCDALPQNFDTAELYRTAIPIIEAALAVERTKNTGMASLSKREVLCLQWVAAGKTSLETGIILGLSPHTVNQYLTEATVKLKAVNRTHAVTKAIRLGLINLCAV